MTEYESSTSYHLILKRKAIGNTVHLGLFSEQPDKAAGKLAVEVCTLAVQGVLDTVGKLVVRPCTFADCAECIADTGNQAG